MRSIDADALECRMYYEAFENEETSFMTRWDSGLWIRYKMFEKCLAETPTIDRPKGKWIRDRYWSRGAGMGEEYGFFYKCSMCEYEVENGYTRCRLNYCPYCGAKMKGADDD